MKADVCESDMKVEGYTFLSKCWCVGDHIKLRFKQVGPEYCVLVLHDCKQLCVHVFITI